MVVVLAPILRMTHCLALSFTVSLSILSRSDDNVRIPPAMAVPTMICTVAGTLAANDLQSRGVRSVNGIAMHVSIQIISIEISWSIWSVFISS